MLKQIENKMFVVYFMERLPIVANSERVKFFVALDESDLKRKVNRWLDVEAIEEFTYEYSEIGFPPNPSEFDGKIYAVRVSTKDSDFYQYFCAKDDAELCRTIEKMFGESVFYFLEIPEWLYESTLPLRYSNSFVVTGRQGIGQHGRFSW